MLANQIETAVKTAPLRTLDNLNQDIWKALLAGMLSEDDAQSLAEAIHERRKATRTKEEQSGGTRDNPQRTTPRTASGASRTGTKPNRAWSYFPPKKRAQRSPDRQRSIERRRTLAASGAMPPQLAARFTTGEQAVLRIVADEVRDKGSCELEVPKIAARAGVCQTLARTAIRHAEALGLLTREERRVPYRRNKTNVLRVICREWLAWITRRPKAKTTGFTFAKATDNKGLRKGRSGAVNELFRGQESPEKGAKASEASSVTRGLAGRDAGRARVYRG